MAGAEEEWGTGGARMLKANGVIGPFGHAIPGPRLVHRACWEAHERHGEQVMADYQLPMQTQPTRASFR